MSDPTKITEDREPNKPGREVAIIGNAEASALVAPRSGLGSNLPAVDEQKKIYREYDKRRQCFYAWLMSKLIEGVHYGFPPGCLPQSGVDPKQWQAKPSLYKAGALLVVDLLQLDPRYSSDLEVWQMLGSPKGTVCIRCDLFHRNGGQLSVGRGAFESNEKRMNANARTKMAQKRSLVDSVITGLPVLGDLFTQDLEGWEKDPITEGQEARLLSLISDPRLPMNWCKAIEARMADGLNKEKANDIIFKSKQMVCKLTGAKEYVPHEHIVDPEECTHVTQADADGDEVCMICDTNLGPQEPPEEAT